MHVEISSSKPPRIFWPLLGLGIVLAADGATALILHTTVQWASDSRLTFYLPIPVFYLAASMAALLVGIPAWFYFIMTPKCATIRRGLLVGIIGSITAHPIMWMLLCIPALFMPQAGALLVLLPLEIVYSLIYGGWATTSIGALAGVLLIHLQRTLTRAQQQRVSRETKALQWREMSNADAVQTGSGVGDERS